MDSKNNIFVVETKVRDNFKLLNNRYFDSVENARACAILDWGLNGEQFRVITLAQRQAKERANRNRQERDQIRRDCGLVRVRGALGGVYWE